jgi:hypothetical protein
MSGMVDRIGVSYYPDWHGTFAQVQRNIVELSKLLPGVKFNIAECSPSYSGSVTNWMSNPNYPVGTVYSVQFQGDDTIRIMQTINDVPNNVGMGVWPWNGQSVYFTGGQPRASFKAWNDAFAKNVLENKVFAATAVGVAPALPATVKSMDVATGAVSDVPVVWDAVDSSQYQKEGSFTVKGRAQAAVPSAGRGAAMTAVSATVDVNNVEINEPVRLAVKVRKPYQLTFDAFGADCEFLSSNANVAKVDENGLVNPLRAGTAYITLKSKDGLNVASIMLSVS